MSIARSFVLLGSLIACGGAVEAIDPIEEPATEPEAAAAPSVPSGNGGTSNVPPASYCKAPRPSCSGDYESIGTCPPDLTYPDCFTISNCGGTATCLLRKKDAGAVVDASFDGG